MKSKEVVIFVGIPASGKTTFYKERFFPSHMYVSLDQVRTRSAEAELFAFCLKRDRSCVVDNTNVNVATRAQYIAKAKNAGSKVIGYCFVTKPDEAISRNAQRVGKAKVPECVIKRMYADLVYPTMEEGFDELYFVRLKEEEFIAEEYDEKWNK